MKAVGRNRTRTYDHLCVRQALYQLSYTPKKNIHVTLELSFCSRKMEELVDLKKISPRIVQEIVYATPYNFLKKAIYPAPKCYLLSKTAERLHLAQLSLEKRGLSLKIFDAYRPLSIQKIFWSFLPDPRYIADPAIGSKHNRGAAVHGTLIDGAGKELLMPTSFDDFSEKAHRSYALAVPLAIKNREILEEAMGAQGFLPFETEWWHFDDPDWENYPVLDISFEALG